MTNESSTRGTDLEPSMLSRGGPSPRSSPLAPLCYSLFTRFRPHLQ